MNNTFELEILSENEILNIKGLHKTNGSLNTYC